MHMICNRVFVRQAGPPRMSAPGSLEIDSRIGALAWAVTRVVVYKHVCMLVIYVILLFV